MLPNILHGKMKKPALAKTGKNGDTFMGSLSVVFQVVKGYLQCGGSGKEENGCRGKRVYHGQN